MTHLKIIIQDLDKETPAAPDIIGKEELQFQTMVVLERGTAEGDTSVSFRLTDDDGNSYLAQMTGNIFRGCFSAFKGADQRFKEKQL